MLDLHSLPADVEALIFDCDGTLVDTPTAYAAAWAIGFGHSGREMAVDWYMQRAGMSEYKLLDAFEAEHDLRLDRVQVVRAMRSAFMERLDQLREIEAITTVARQNQSLRPMAVASGGSQAIVSATLQATRLSPLFDAVVTIDDVGKAKPEPDLFLEAARRLGVAPHACLVFEDSREGLEAAHRAGMRAIDVLAVIGSGCANVR